MSTNDTTFQQYQRHIRALLWRVLQRPLQTQVDLWLKRCRQAAPDQPCVQVYQQLRSQIIEQLVQQRLESSQLVETKQVARRAQRLRTLLEAKIAQQPDPNQPDFHCDAGLGGTARWLRAAGYDARFWPGIEDDSLVKKATPGGSILLTTDRRLMQRAVVVWGLVPALLVPLHAGGKRGQFRYVVQQLELPRQAARCMACGGTLQPVAKEAVRDRIPPRTYPRCNEYLLCESCGKLYWRGTHWHEIERQLIAAAPAAQN